LPELQISSRDGYIMRASYAGLQIDISLTQKPLFKKIQRSYAKVERFLDRFRKD
jgi:hypothetical protein